MCGQNETNNQHGKGIDPTPPHASESLNRPPPHPATADQLEEIKKDVGAFERTTLRWTRTAVVVASIAAILVGLQWRVMQGQLDQMVQSGGQTDNLIQQATAQANAARATAEATKEIAERALRQAEATNRLATEAKKSANIADNALRVNQESASLDRRPWIGFNFINIITESGGSLRVHLTGLIGNTGKTPAVKVSRKVYFVLRYRYNKSGLDVDSIAREYRLLDGREFPNEGATVINNVMDEGRNKKVIIRIDDDDLVIKVVPPNDKREFPILQDYQFNECKTKSIDIYDRKGVFAYIVGKITYFDLTRTKEYTTDFCIERDFEEDHPRFRPCQFGNDMK